MLNGVLSVFDAVFIRVIQTIAYGLLNG